MSEAKTIDDLFPGVTGRMDLVRVMILLKRPELRDLPRDQALEPELVAELQRAMSEVRDG